MQEFSNQQILQFAIDNAMLSLDDIQEIMKNNERKKCLELHNHSIYQGNDSYWYTYVNTDTGRKKIKRKEKRSVEDAVYEFYKSKVEEPTIKDVFCSWIEEKYQYGEIKKQSYDRYIADFNRFFVDNPSFPEFANQKIKHIGEEELERFIRSTIVQMELTQKAYTGLRTLINGIFKYAKKKKYISFSITAFMGDLDLSKRSFKKIVKDKKEQVYQEEEAELLIKYLSKQTEDIRCLGVLLLFYTGLRIGELSALKPCDISEQYLHIQRTEVKVKTEEGALSVQEYPKSDAGERYVILTPGAQKVVQTILQIRENGEYLFCENGKRIRSNGFRRKLMRVCKTVGVPYRSNHKIRKTYGTTLIDAGVDDAIIAEQMGHTDIGTTKKYYYYSNKNENKKIEQINAAVSW